MDKTGLMNIKSAHDDCAFLEHPVMWLNQLGNITGHGITIIINYLKLDQTSIKIFKQLKK